MGIMYTQPTPDLTIAAIVDAFGPSIVYTHSSADLHHEHREVHERVLVACRPQSGVKSIYAFETPSATEWGVRPFTPTRFVDISATFNKKLRAMHAYESEMREFPHPRSERGLISRADHWGMFAGVDCAEAFEVVREIR
jgi:LmbE family N-acetylglucosaminyl deacetylase